MIHTMSELKNTEVLSRFNKLKKQYECDYLDENVIFTDEDINEKDIKNTMFNFNIIIKSKVTTLRNLKSNIDKLAEYKKGIVDIIVDMKKMEEKYVDLFQRNVLNSLDMKLTPPQYGNLKELLSGDLRKVPDIDDCKDVVRMKNVLFTIKDDYLTNMNDVCDKIDNKISDESIKMNKINDYIEVYKKTLSSFDVDKRIFTKYGCTVCYENEVNTCLIPCGHTFCKKCSDRVDTKCFACNGVITSKTQIFLLGNDDYDNELAPAVGATLAPIPIGANYGAFN